MHPGPVLQRLRQVLRGDLLTPGQISNRARQLQHAVIPARRELQLVHGRLHQAAAGVVQVTELAHLGRAHIR